MKKFELERTSGTSTYWIKYADKNKNGETLLIELTKCTNPGGNNSLPRLWKKHGFIDRELETWWSISTYVHDEDNNCWGKYNPQHYYAKRVHKGKTISSVPKINFDLMMDATYENAITLLKECERWFLECKKNKVIKEEV